MGYGFYRAMAKPKGGEGKPSEKGTKAQMSLKHLL